jgi:hypothetical protein
MAPMDAERFERIKHILATLDAMPVPTARPISTARAAETTSCDPTSRP